MNISKKKRESNLKLHMPDEIEQHQDHRLHNLHQFHINESKMMRAGNFLRESRQFDAEMQDRNSKIPCKIKISEG